MCAGGCGGGSGITTGGNAPGAPTTIGNNGPANPFAPSQGGNNAAAAAANGDAFPWLAVLIVGGLCYLIFKDK